MAPTWRHVQYSLSELSHAHQDGYGGDDKDGDAGSNERDDSFTPVQPRHSRLLLHLIGFQPRGHSISPLPKLMMLAAIKNTTTSATTTSAVLASRCKRSALRPWPKRSLLELCILKSCYPHSTMTARKMQLLQCIYSRQCSLQQIFEHCPATGRKETKF